MMCTSKQFNEFVECKKIYYFLAAARLRAGCTGKAALVVGGFVSAATSPAPPSAMTHSPPHTKIYFFPTNYFLPSFSQ